MEEETHTIRIRGRLIPPSGTYETPYGPVEFNKEDVDRLIRNTHEYYASPYTRKTVPVTVEYQMFNIVGWIVDWISKPDGSVDVSVEIVAHTTDQLKEQQKYLMTFKGITFTTSGRVEDENTYIWDVTFSNTGLWPCQLEIDERVIENLTSGS